MNDEHVWHLRWRPLLLRNSLRAAAHREGESEVRAVSKQDRVQQVAWTSIATPGRAPVHLGNRRWATWCEQCRSRFVAGTQFARYCSQRCRDRAKATTSHHAHQVALAALTRRCEHCLEWILTVNPRRRFCGDSCRNASWRAACRDTATPARACQWCEATLQRRHQRRRFCGDACRVASWRASRRDAMTLPATTDEATEATLIGIT